jgi:hypothetical protein
MTMIHVLVDQDLLQIQSHLVLLGGILLFAAWTAPCACIKTERRNITETEYRKSMVIPCKPEP